MNDKNQDDVAVMDYKIMLNVAVDGTDSFKIEMSDGDNILVEVDRSLGELYSTLNTIK